MSGAMVVEVVGAKPRCDKTPHDYCNTAHIIFVLLKLKDANVLSIIFMAYLLSIIQIVSGNLIRVGVS